MNVLNTSRVFFKLSLLLVLILILSIFGFSEPPEWYRKFRQVKPMVSTKQEVEKLFVNPEIAYTFDGEWSKEVKYKTDVVLEGVIFASYSQGKCSEMKTDGYNVEKDIVLDISIYMEEGFDISLFGFNLDNFKKYKIEDITDAYTFRNNISGEYFSGTSEKLNHFELFPPKNQDYLKCKSND